MAKTDWNLNDTVRPQDMNDIGEEINQLRNDIDNIDVPPASLTKAGIVQLNDAVNDTSITTAATANAVKKAYDRADQAFQLGNERKQEVVDVLIAKGISASTSESWDSLIAKLAGIIKATGNATAAQLLQGYTASNASGTITGGMINRTAEAHHQPAADTAVFPGDRLFLAPPQGYFSGDSWVFAPAPQLSPDNLPKDVNILGIIGTLERMTTAEKQAIVNAITAKGIPASVNDSNTVLAQKIGQITQGIISEIIFDDTQNSSGSKESFITTIPEGIKKCIFVPSRPYSMSLRATVTNLSAEIVAIDRNGVRISVLYVNVGDHIIESIEVDRLNRYIRTLYTNVNGVRLFYFSDLSADDFDLNGPITLVSVLTRSGSNGSCTISLESVMVGA